MLIIFDLDDTLVDTTGSITPHKLSSAIDEMIFAGAGFPDRQRALEQLEQLNTTSLSARRAVDEFIAINELPDKYKAIALKEIYEKPLQDHPVFPLEDGPQLIEKLSGAHQLAIVSIGVEGHQLEKLKKCGYNPRLFSKILVIQEEDKGAAYAQVMSDLGFEPSDTIVCGDRISRDLQPAKKLGITTVQMHWGRGLNDSGLKSDVDYDIMRLQQLLNVVKDLRQHA